MNCSLGPSRVSYRDAVSAAEDRLPVPPFVDWPLFPFEGDLRVKAVAEREPGDRPRSGEPGGEACGSCARDDSEYLWTNEHWRVARGMRSAVKQVFLETRAHVDLADMPTDVSAELGPSIQRVERAMLAAGDIGRVHVHRWGDGAEHFHLWLYGRPIGDRHMLGFGLVLWAMVLPPISEDDWDDAMRAVAEALAHD